MMINFILKRKKIFSLLFLGVGLRLIYGLLFNQMVDYMNILALVKSIADTGDFTYGLTALKRIGFEVQLYGKIYYQIIALWLKFLEKIKILNIDYIFDTKPLTDPASYMIGLWQWSPPLYQLTVIKLIQFLFDFFFVFFLYKTARLINKNLAWLAILFWALNPYFMMISYAFFMPDIFMLGAFTAGVYFWLKAIDNKNPINKDGILALFFLVLGAIIKQLPLLIIPFFFLSLIKNKKSFSLYFFSFLFFYLYLKQSWAKDSYFINKFFLFSQESKGILETQFNSIPYFLIFYFFIFIIFYLKGKSFINKKEVILSIIVIIISLVYIHEPRFFIQFTIWILPFAFLLSLTSFKKYPVFVLSTIIILIKSIVNDMYLSPLFSPTIGSMYNEFTPIQLFINKFFNFQIYDMLSKLFIFLICIIIIFELLIINLKNNSILFEKINQYFHYLDYKKIILLTFFIYIFLNIFDFLFKSSFILLPQQKHQISNEQIRISKKQIKIKIYNPSLRKINALQLGIIKKGSLIFEDYLILDFYKNGKKLFSKKINDYELPTSIEEPLIVFLPQSLKENVFQINIYKEKDLNEVVIYKSVILQQLNKPENNLFEGYEKPPQTSWITVDFQNKNENFPIYFRGQYRINDIINAINHHAKGKIKKIFFISYLLSSFLLISTSIYLLKIKK